MPKNRFTTKLRKGDLVQILSGKDKGKQGKILSIILKTGRAIIEGVNVVHRHLKPSQKNPQGGILSQPAPVHLSKIAAIDPHSGKPTRIGTKKLTAKGSVKSKTIRVAKVSGQPLDEIQKGE